MCCKRNIEIYLQEIDILLFSFIYCKDADDLSSLKSRMDIIRTNSL